MSTRRMPSVHRIISLDEPEAWGRSLEGIPHGFAHTWDYIDAIARSMGQPIGLYSYSNGDDRFVCPLATRSFGGLRDLFTPIGFSGFTGCGDFLAFMRHWREYARTSGYVCGYIGLNPIFCGKVAKALQDYSEHNEIYVLNLVLPEAVLLQRLSRNRKRQLKRSARGDLSLVEDKDVLLAFFLERLNSFLREKEASPEYQFSEETIRALFASNRTLAIGSESGGTVESAVLFGYTPYCGDYLFGISINEGDRHSAALVWHAAMKLRSAGVRSVNLGGGISKGDGVAEFKARFGADVIPLGSLKQVYRADEYAFLCQLANVNPLSRQDYFPAYRTPRRITTHPGISSNVH
jgi:hypothetical protein